jgi:hypothetical protein
MTKLGPVSTPPLSQQPVNVRIYSDGKHKDSVQGLASSFVSFATLTLYTGWLHVLLGLIIASFFSRIALALLILIFSTLLLPAKPVLW